MNIQSYDSIWRMASVEAAKYNLPLYAIATRAPVHWPQNARLPEPGDR